MKKIEVFLFAVSIIGLTNADEVLNCAFKFPTHLMLDRCCYQLKGMTSYEYSFQKCLEKYEDTPRPEYCAARCALNETGNPDGSMNYEGYHEFLVGQVKEPILIKHMMHTVKNCEAQVIEMLKDHRYNTAASKPCGQRVHLMHRCTASHGILNCPIQKWRKGNSYCDQILEDAKDCPF